VALLTIFIATLKALRIIVDEEPEPSPRGERPMIGSGLTGIPGSLQRLHQEERSVKHEAEFRMHIKHERNSGREVYEDSDDLYVLETRSCKRPRGGQEVIVLD
jgi:hypothetical protein